MKPKYIQQKSVDNLAPSKFMVHKKHVEVPMPLKQMKSVNSHNPQKLNLPRDRTLTVTALSKQMSLQAKKVGSPASKSINDFETLLKKNRLSGNHKSFLC